MGYGLDAGRIGVRMQGLPYEPNDIDIQTDERGAYLFGELFEEFELQAVHPRRDSDVVRSHFGKFVVNRSVVEVMGDMQKRGSDGDWEPPPQLALLKRHIIFEGLRVPVFPLEYEADSYRKMRRLNKATTLAEWAARG